MTILDRAPVPEAPAKPDLIEHMTAQLETSLATHLGRAQEWFPHEYVPWGEARDFAELPYAETQCRLSPAVKASVVLNLLTEDNLPGYHGELGRLLGGNDASGSDLWRTWLNRWTAEEGRHAIAMRDYLLVTRVVDPVTLERDRMATVSAGFHTPDKDGLHTIAYVSLQELATRVSHRATGKMSGDPGLDRLLGRIATDENHHMVLYRDLLAAALEVAPAITIRALTDEVAGFEMPGTGIPGFVRRAAVVARAGIYDLQVHRDQVIEPMIRFWGVLALEGLTAEAEAERDRLVLVLAELDRRVDKQLVRRAARPVKEGTTP